MGKRSKEFWQAAVEACEGRSVAEVAREVGVPYQTLYTKVHKARKAATPREPESAGEELKRLRRENQRLAEELESQKKRRPSSRGTRSEV